MKLKLGEFAGPLDLLLHLIKQEKVNIYDVPIARIADEYLRYLRFMRNFDIAVAGDFLVMATTLIDIKAKMLLPRDFLDEAHDADEIDPRRALIERLLEHQKYKSAAQMLWEKTTIEQSVFGRGKLETSDFEKPETMLSNVSMFDLLSLFQKISARRKVEFSLEVKREEMTLSAMLETLRTRLQLESPINVNDFLAATTTKRELVLAFLAVLEISRERGLRIIQSQIFGKIMLEKA
ncbi:MAG: segregation/condensation protein A [Pyrinomonadaceae bacterium]|nr:segregation/condensation protein A [Pyrinomonadaceae bacterium]